MSVNLRTAAKLLTTFLVGQGAIQILNVVTGLFLLRQLSIPAYAQYSLAFAFQTASISLTNLGLTESIIPLVGARGEDRAVVGTYVRSAQYLRNRLFLIVAPLVAVAFLVIVHNHQWSMTVQLMLLSSVLAALYFSVSVSGWSAPLLLRRRLFDYYLGQTIASVTRLCAYLVAAVIQQLGAVFALATSAASILLNGIILRKQSAQLVELPLQADKKANKEVLTCMLPMMPAAIFSSFQPQIALFLVSIFAATTQIAQVAALGRIAQLFLIFSTFNTVVIEPYVARVPVERLPGVLARIVCGAALIGACITVLSFVFPGALLWILGAKYADLESVIGWVVLSSSISTTANVMWVINRGRRWLFWRGSFIEISGLILFQAAYLVLYGVRTTLDAAMLMVAASCAHLLAHSYVLLYGLAAHRDPQARPA